MCGQSSEKLSLAGICRKSISRKPLQIVFTYPYQLSTLAVSVLLNSGINLYKARNIDVKAQEAAMHCSDSTNKRNNIKACKEFCVNLKLPQSYLSQSP